MKMIKDLEKENIGTQNKYKDSIFGKNTRIYDECLYEPRGQEIIDRCIYHKRLKRPWVQDICHTLTNRAEKDEVLTDRGTGIFIKLLWPLI